MDEPLYRVDRAVRQLLLAGVFRGVAGVVLGRFSGMKPAERRGVAPLFLEALGDRRVPVVAGFPAGHGSPNRPIPFGVPATLDADAGTLVFDPCVAGSRIPLDPPLPKGDARRFAHPNRAREQRRGGAKRGTPGERTEGSTTGVRSDRTPERALT